MDLICDPRRCYCFTTTEGLPWYPEETATGEQVDKFGAEFLSDHLGKFIRGVKPWKAKSPGVRQGFRCSVSHRALPGQTQSEVDGARCQHQSDLIRDKLPLPDLANRGKEIPAFTGALLLTKEVCSSP